MDDGLTDKIALFCDVEKRAVIPMVTTPVLYEVPLLLEEAGVGDYLVERLGLKSARKPEWKAWEKLIAEVRREKPKLKIALVGKYVELQDAYMSVREALKHAALSLGVETDLQWVHSVDLEKGKGWEVVKEAAGIIVPGGFGSRGIEGKIQAAKYARENKVPYLGLCLGMQLMVVEFARDVLGWENANSTEFDRSTPYPVIDLMLEQRAITDMGGTMRLGLYPCVLQPGTKTAEAYAAPQVEERHRHRFELNNAYREQLQKAGMVFSGISPDGKLVEIAEIEDHPYMLGSQFHPEFLSRPMRPHPLFVGLVKAAKERIMP
jgi:CTP synthase